MAPKSGNQRNYDAELAKARWESMNNHPAGYWNELARQNRESGRTLADTRFTSTADGSDPYYPAQSSMLDTLVTGTAHAIPASFGWRTPYEDGHSKTDPSKREWLTGPDLAKAGFGPRAVKTTADIANTAGDVVAAPKFAIPAYAAGFSDNPWVQIGGVTAGATAQAYGGKIAKKIAPNAGRQITRTAVRHLGANGTRTVAGALKTAGKATKVVGPVSAVLMNGSEIINPTTQLRDELQNEAEWIRRQGQYGRGWKAGTSRVLANVLNNVDKGVDAGSYVLAAGTLNPEWLALSNGSNVRTVRGYMNALNNKSGSDLESAAMGAHMDEMNGFDWFGGGKVSADVPNLVYQKATNVARGNFGDPKRVGWSNQRFNDWRNSRRAEGMSEPDIQREAERIRKQYPYYFYQNIPESMRTATETELFRRGMEKERQLQSQIWEKNRAAGQ